MKKRIGHATKVCIVLSVVVSMMSIDTATACRRSHQRRSRCCRGVRCCCVCEPVDCSGGTADDVPLAPPIPPAEPQVPPLPPEEPATPAAPPKDPARESAAPAPATPTAATETPMRMWNDSTGEYQVRARLFEIQEDRVRLFKENGNYCTVPLMRLSAADRQYVESLALRYGAGVIGEVAAR